MPPGNAIISALGSPGPAIPQSLLLNLHISYTSYLWTKALGDDESTSNGQHPSPSHLMSTFESQAAQIQARFSSFIWPKFLEIMFAGLKLQAYSFALNRQLPETADRGAPAMPHATDEMLRAKALSAMITVATEARKDAPSLRYWPVFARNNVIFAVCLGVYMAATASDGVMKTSVLETCKNSVQLLYGWALYSRDSFSRITKHITTSIRRIESHGAHGLLSADDPAGRPDVTSRMANNIPYQLVWRAKHGRTPDPAPEAAPTFFAPAQAQTRAVQHPANVQDSTMSYQNQPEQVFGYFSFGDIDDSMFLEDWTEADFTDIALDWQSMIPVPGTAWS